MTTLQRVDKEDLEEGKIYIFVKPGVLGVAVKIHSVNVISFQDGQFYGPIELEG